MTQFYCIILLWLLPLSAGMKILIQWLMLFSNGISLLLQWHVQSSEIITLTELLLLPMKVTQWSINADTALSKKSPHFFPQQNKNVIAF